MVKKVMDKEVNLREQDLNTCLYCIVSREKKLTRQQMKMQELAALTKTCLTKDHGETTEDFYDCIKTEAERRLQ